MEYDNKQTEQFIFTGYRTLIHIYTKIKCGFIIGVIIFKSELRNNNTKNFKLSVWIIILSLRRIFIFINHVS